MRTVLFVFLLISSLGFGQSSDELIVCFGPRRLLETAYRISESPTKISSLDLSAKEDSLISLEKADFFVSFPNCNVMYSGYGNIMQIGSEKKNVRKITLKCDGCDTLFRPKNGDGSEWVIRANKTNKVTLFAIDQKGKTISSVDIPVFELPRPHVFLDSLDAQSTLSSVPEKIKLKLDENIPLSTNFHVTRWEIVINNRETFTGVGNKISDSVREYLAAQTTGTIIMTIEYIVPSVIKTTKEIFEFNLSL